MLFGEIGYISAPVHALINHGWILSDINQTISALVKSQGKRLPFRRQIWPLWDETNTHGQFPQTTLAIAKLSLLGAKKLRLTRAHSWSTGRNKNDIHYTFEAVFVPRMPRMPRMPRILLVQMRKLLYILGRNIRGERGKRGKLFRWSNRSQGKYFWYG